MNLEKTSNKKVNGMKKQYWLILSGITERVDAKKWIRVIIETNNVKDVVKEE